MKFHTLLLAILAAAGPFPAAAQQVPDAGRGLDLARRWCAACHVVERGGAGADGTVGFPAVADDRSTTRERITTFLAAPHGGMADPGLSRRDAADIAEHILRLRATAR